MISLFLRPTAPQVFISYRRDDAGGYAGRLRDDLREVLGPNRVRMDIGGLEYGGEFEAEARSIVAGSGVLLALIGKRWADEDNAPRLADPNDLLRQEIETALAANVRVVPVLLNGAALPPADALPESLRPLLKRNAFELSESRWTYDVGQLVKFIRRLPRPKLGAGTPAGSRRVMMGAGVAGVLLAGALGYKRLNPADPGPPHEAAADSVPGATHVKSPEEPSEDRQVNPPAGAGRPANPDGRMFRIDHQKFLAAYTREFGVPTAAKRTQLDGLLYLIDSDTALKDIRWAAYLLATIKHETADTWYPLEEYNQGRGRFYGDTITVTDPAGRSYRNVYYGRGYLQLTGEQVYRQMGRVLGNRLVYEPDLAQEPSIAYAILSVSMRGGLQTGKKLSDFINDTRTDYVNARRTVNGLDQAQRIAGYATRLEKVLRESTPAAPRFRVAMPSLYLRAGPDLSQPVVGERVPIGTVVQEVGTEGAWKQVVVPATGARGWALRSFLSPDSASARP